MKKNKIKYIVIVLVFIVIVTASVIAGIIINKNDEKLERLVIDNKVTSKIGQTTEIIGETKRNIPTTTSNEGLNSRYPVYGTSLANITDEEKENILKEDALLRASSTTYDSMDENGNLYLNGEPINRKLYKHSASVNMYYGDVSDDEKAVMAKVTIKPIEQRNYITGLYAPAGEVVKIEISEEDLNNIGSLTVVVGQTSHRNINNNIWKDRNDFVRMPNIGNIMSINSTTGYVGNYLGGPIYLYPERFDSEFSVTISGAVQYAYFIYGQTTEEDVEKMKDFSAPYYDFEIWDTGVRHSGPKAYANYDYKNLMQVGDIWEKIIRTSNEVPNSSNKYIGVDFVYDPFVAAGAAVAFVGGNKWVNAPPSWMSGSLNYKAITTTGMWGNIHEFNHHYQNYGIGDMIEVTNNATSLLSYVLYTNISALRSTNDSSLGSGWNRFTDPSRSLRETLSLSNSGDPQSSLNIYADMIHSFGVDNFIQATKLDAGKRTADAWYDALCTVTGYDLTYYFESILNQPLSDSVKEKYQNKGLPVFIPIASVYQTGRSYYVNDNEVFVETVKPYEIEAGEDFTLDFNNYLTVPNGFTYSIREISNPMSGELTKISENVYKYTPGKSEYSSTMKVVVSIEHPTIEVKDITLTINLRQRISNLLNKTKYIYDSKKYNSVSEALSNNFEGYSSVIEEKINSTFINGINPAQIGIVEGKIYISEDGNYAFQLRCGRGNNTLYLSFNNRDNYTQVISVNGNGNNTTKTEYYSLKKGDYVYFKEITLSTTYDAFSELKLVTKNNETETVSNISSDNLYNVDVYYKEYDFKSEEKYFRNYLVNEVVSVHDVTKEKLVSLENYTQWDNTTKIDNIFDGDLNTFYHSEANHFISNGDPFILTVDLGENVNCNSLTLIGRNSGQVHMPTSFKLYGGNSLDSMELIGEYSNLTYSNKRLKVTFEEKNIRYYKLEVTDTDSHRYISVAQINVCYEYNGTLKSLDELEYYNTSKKQFVIENKTISTFGHLISGNGIIKYKFKGTKFGLYVKQKEKCVIEVEIDGVKKEVELTNNNSTTLGYLSDLLQNKEHEVKIKVLKGKIQVDSFTIS